jgi:hypothetical protein
MKEVDRVTFNIGTIHRLDGHNRDLGMRFPIDLAADLIHLRDRVLIQNVRKVIDVVGGFELGDGFSWRSQNHCQRDGRNETQLCPRLHRKENCTGATGREEFDYRGIPQEEITQRDDTASISLDGLDNLLVHAQQHHGATLQLYAIFVGSDDRSLRRIGRSGG